MKLILGTSKTCGPCMVVKKKLAALGLEVEIKDASNADDIEFFRKHGIKSVPVLVMDDGSGGEVEIVKGIDEIVDAVKNNQ